MMETSKAQTWNRLIKALLHAEKQWIAFSEHSGAIDEIKTTPAVRRGMSAYGRASNFMWFMEGFMRYVQTTGGLKAMLIEVINEKENDDART